jgi:hypothetical protein
MRVLLSAILLALLVGGAVGQKKDRRGVPLPKGPDLAVVNIRIQREPRVVSVEGALRNSSERPLSGVKLYFVFLESGGATITRKNIEVGEGAIEPGEEAAFLGQTVDPVRAVWVRLEAADKNGRVLTIDKPGPYDIQ